jgi:hypothetical protein
MIVLRRGQSKAKGRQAQAQPTLPTGRGKAQYSAPPASDANDAKLRGCKWFQPSPDVGYGVTLPQRWGRVGWGLYQALPGARAAWPASCPCRMPARRRRSTCAKGRGKAQYSATPASNANDAKLRGCKWFQPSPDVGYGVTLPQRWGRVGWGLYQALLGARAAWPASCPCRMPTRCRRSTCAKGRGVVLCDERGRMPTGMSAVRRATLTTGARKGLTRATSVVTVCASGEGKRVPPRRPRAHRTA